MNARREFLFLNIGHFYDHLFILLFGTVAALALTADWGLSYAELIPYATPGFIAFGVCAVPAGWLADKWSRRNMMVVYFIGIGASAILTGFANTPFQLAAGLLAIGIFAAIYHPVGLALVVEGRTKTGVPLAVNGVFGNMGVACAALIAGVLIDLADWRAAFYLPGAISVATGFAYWALKARPPSQANPPDVRRTKQPISDPGSVSVYYRIFAIIFVSTALGGLVFQSTTFALPKIFDERLVSFAGNATLIGGFAFIVFAAASFAQLGVGYLIDRRSIRTVFVAIAASQAILFFLMQNLTGLPAFFVAVGFMLMVFGQIPINDVLIGRVAASEWRSRVYAFRYLVTFSVMASTVPLIAWVQGNWGFSSLFLILSGAAAIIFISVLLLPRRSAYLFPAADNTPKTSMGLEVP